MSAIQGMHPRGVRAKRAAPGRDLDGEQPQGEERGCDERLAADVPISGEG